MVSKSSRGDFIQWTSRHQGSQVSSSEDLYEFGNSIWGLILLWFRIALAVAFIYLITAVNDHEMRKEAYNTLVRCNKKNAPLVGEILQEGLTNWLVNVSTQSRLCMYASPGLQVFSFRPLLNQILIIYIFFINCNDFFNLKFRLCSSKRAIKILLQCWLLQVLHH